ncbi:MAG: hypothetical protein CO094_10155 [Anaerolineae bacterium CG_4_9_14_3_um_filter_57_17]|nr:MAG: hypothetical protein CO094_10155 [Anaerolineae bacterium CG_4_9_14_3_um_filter_57_17]
MFARQSGAFWFKRNRRGHPLRNTSSTLKRSLRGKVRPFEMVIFISQSLDFCLLVAQICRQFFNQIQQAPNQLPGVFFVNGA